MRQAYARVDSREELIPYTHAPLLSRLFFQYCQPYLKIGTIRPITGEDLPSAPPDVLCDVNYEKFEGIYKEEMMNDDSHFGLIKALWKMVVGRYVVLLLLFTASIMGDFFAPFVLSWIIEFISTGNDDVVYGIGLCVLMAGVTIVQTLLFENFCYRAKVVEFALRAALKTAIFEKSLRISNLSKGNAQNIMNIDPDTIAGYIWFGYKAVCFPLYILGSVICLFIFLGLPSFTTPILIALLMPIIFVLLGGFTKTYNKIMTIKDKRISKLSELLQAMMIVKTFCWESIVKRSVQEIREEETKYLKRFNYTLAFYMFFLISLYTIVSVATLTVYALFGGNIAASIIFPVLMIFQTFSWPITELPNVIMESTEAYVSIKRVDKFLRRSELVPRNIDMNLDPKITVRNATFSHYEIDVEEDDDDEQISEEIVSPFFFKSENSEKETFKLENISFSAEQGELVAVIGRVGAGKSSLLSALLGEMVLESGKLEYSGSSSVVSQQAWIYNSTIRNNILNGKPMDDSYYHSVLEACALQSDLEIITGGDHAEIGEKGINLSGGQKARISLARAVYSKSDIILLDDPLSAVDSHVGHHLFHKCISKKLNDKIRILVTHQLQYLPYVDKIIVMEGGKIQQVGTYEELFETGFDFAQLLQSIKREDSELNTSTDLRNSNNLISTELFGSSEINISTEILLDSDDQHEDAKIGKIIDVEERSTGSISISVYLSYFKTLGGMKILFAMFFLSTMYQLLAIARSIWVVFWSEDEDPKKIYFYLFIYVGIGIALCLFAFLRQFFWAKVTLEGSRNLHEKQLGAIFRAPMSYFHTTPTGRIINRFSKDQQSVDVEIPDEMSDVLLCVLEISSIFITSIVVTKGVFAIVLLPLAILYYFILQYFTNTNRELGRLQSIAKSPVFAHYSEVIDGLPVIRGFGTERNVSNRMRDLVNIVISMELFQAATFRWLGIRIRFVSLMSMTVISVIGVLAKGFLKPSEVGLLLSFTGQLMGGLNWFVRAYSSLEGHMNHVERILEMINLGSEADLVNPNYRPTDTWPERGEIIFDDVSMRYRENLPYVLKNVSFKIASEEKVGVVGRTGAGKSSLINVLFRLVEFTGSVIIDDILIEEIGLHDLRKKIAIIPQDAVLFSGTVRSNIDPFEEYRDDEVWTVLERVHLKKYISQLDGRLESEVVEGGKNFSVGQRQLICIGRALLLNTKIIIMDEATASVDNETDELIQETIRKEFEDRTVFTIAHRLNTIMDSDKIMVMDSGELVEFDSPRNLLDDQHGKFTALVENTGEGNSEYLRQLVKI